MNTSIDVTIIGLLVYAFIYVLRRLRLTQLIFGFLTLFVIYIVANFYDLKLTRLFFQQFAGVFIIVLTIIFQREIRKYLEIISFTSIKDFTIKVREDIIGTIESAVLSLAQHKIGALIVIKGHEPLDRFILNKYDLNGIPSLPLIMSIFDHTSPGHDGAMIIENNIVTSFGVYLSVNRPYRGTAKYGTRHLAALNLTKNSDAFIIVVSEERGTISVAHNGTLAEKTPEEFSKALERFSGMHQKKRNLLLTFFLQEIPFFALSLVVAIILWVYLYR